MSRFHATMTMNGTYEFIVEANNLAEAELEAANTEIYLSKVEFWDTELNLEEEN